MYRITESQFQATAKIWKDILDLERHIGFGNTYSIWKDIFDLERHIRFGNTYSIWKEIFDLEIHIRFHNKTGDALRTDVGHLALNTFTNLFVHNKWEYNAKLSVWVWDDSVPVVTVKFCACKMAYLHQMTIGEQLLLRRHVFKHVHIQTPF